MNRTEASYVAGFFDGDGSLHFQLVRQKEYRFGFYIRCSMSLSQSTDARWGLEELKSLIGGGYLRDRGTGMSDLVVTSRPMLTRVLTDIRPYVIFKRVHVERGLDLLPLIGDRRIGAEEFVQLAREVDRFAALNHSKSKRIFAADVERHLRGKGVSTPVTTSSFAQRGDGVGTGIIGPPKLKGAMIRRPLETG